VFAYACGGKQSFNFWILHHIEFDNYIHASIWSAFDFAKPELQKV
jgi:hypothetical protein